MPPLWCSLPGDPNLYERPEPMEGSPGIIRLEESSRCMCGAQYNPDLPILCVPCIIYGASRAVEAKIEVQRCPTCYWRRRRYIGPDGRERGLFNWRNQTLFTHDLLDEYTIAYTTSETPFKAWVSVINGRYETYRSRHRFVSAGLFRSAWCSFASLQDFSNDMTCSICGPNPEDIIWDGVTVAFGKRRILPSLKPPTTTSESSPIREKIHYYPDQQLIPDRETRQLVLSALVSHEKLRKEDNTEVDIHEADQATARQQEYIEAISAAEERLMGVNMGLRTVFAQKIGSLRGTTSPAPAYLELFRQVRVQQKDTS